MDLDEELTIAIPAWMIQRVRAAKAAVEAAEVEETEASDRGQRLAADAHYTEARAELEKARELLVHEVLARASRLGGK